MSQPTAKSHEQTNLYNEVERIIDLIRPSIQDDGGDVELVDITDEGIVKIRLHGACVGCPSSQMTLQMGIEKNLRQRVPGVAGVEQVH
jgi:Fe-S cluster biogenesis protein NfuA